MKIPVELKPIFFYHYIDDDDDDDDKFRQKRRKHCEFHLICIAKRSNFSYC